MNSTHVDKNFVRLIYEIYEQDIKFLVLEGKKNDKSETIELCDKTTGYRSEFFKSLFLPTEWFLQDGVKNVNLIIHTKYSNELIKFNLRFL